MKIYLKGKKIDVDVRKVNGLGFVRGLMFKNKNCDNLLFSFNRDVSMAIHSWFVGFDFLAIWLDSKKRVIEYRIVKPWSFHIKPKKKFRYLVEMPVNEENRNIISNIVK